MRKPPRPCLRARQIAFVAVEAIFEALMQAPPEVQGSVAEKIHQ
jgi:hypothetical protein